MRWGLRRGGGLEGEEAWEEGFASHSPLLNAQGSPERHEPPVRLVVHGWGSSGSSLPLPAPENVALSLDPSAAVAQQCLAHGSWLLPPSPFFPSRGYYADVPFVSESVYHQVQLSEYA